MTVFVSLPSRRVNRVEALAGAAPLQAEHIIVCRWYSGISVLSWDGFLFYVGENATQFHRIGSVLSRTAPILTRSEPQGVDLVASLQKLPASTDFNYIPRIPKLQRKAG